MNENSRALIEGVKFNGLRMSAGVWIFWIEGKPLRGLFPLEEEWKEGGV